MNSALDPVSVQSKENMIWLENSEIDFFVKNIPRLHNVTLFHISTVVGVE